VTREQFEKSILCLTEYKRIKFGNFFVQYTEFIFINNGFQILSLIMSKVLNNL
jgi:hypothetical protein